MGPVGQTRAGTVPTNPRPATLVLGGQVCFAASLAVAVALHPGFVLKADEGGISNYGTHLVTVVPYTLAFLLAAVLSLAAAGDYRRAGPPGRALAHLLVVYACLLALTLVSTYVYTQDTVLRQVHVGVGVVLVAFELVASLWMYHRLRSTTDAVLLAALVCGCVLAGLTVLGVLHVLFVGQALAAAGFAVLLVRLAGRTPAGAP